MELKEMRIRRLREYLKAEEAILSGQEYTIGDRALKRADLRWVQKAITDLMSELGTSRGRLRQVVFMN